MRLLNWLFHPVNLLIVVVLLVLYLNRQSLFPEVSGSPDVQQLIGRVDTVIDAMDKPAKAPSAMPAAPTDKERQGSVRVAEPAEDISNPSERAEQKSISLQPPDDLSDPGVNNEPVSAQRPDDLSEPDVAAEPVPATLSGREEGAGEPASVAVETEGVDAVDPATGGKPARVKGSAAHPLELWRKARQAAWNNQPLQAIEYYRSLIALQPNHYDAYGEMGNVMMRTGDTQSAVAAYYQAAILLNQSGYPQQAWQLQGVVARLDYTKGYELYQALRQQRMAPLRSNE